MEAKKPKKSIFRKVKDWWNELPVGTRDIITVMGCAGLEGIILGSGVTMMVEDHRYKRDISRAAGEAYLIGVSDGKQEAYRDVACSKVTIQGHKEGC